MLAITLSLLWVSLSLYFFAKTAEIVVRNVRGPSDGIDHVRPIKRST